MWYRLHLLLIVISSKFPRSISAGCQTGPRSGVLTIVSVFQQLLGIHITRSAPILTNSPLTNFIYCSPRSSIFKTHLWHPLPFSAGAFLHVFCSAGVKSLICLSRPSTFSVRSAWDLTLILGLMARRRSGARSWEGRTLSYKAPVSSEAFVQSSGEAGWE